jgi:hypothetical protein
MRSFEGAESWWGAALARVRRSPVEHVSHDQNPPACSDEFGLAITQHSKAKTSACVYMLLFQSIVYLSMTALPLSPNTSKPSHKLKHDGQKST